MLIVSTELDEIYALADRIAVFFHGRLMGIVGPDTPREALGRMMAGEPADSVLPPAPWDHSHDDGGSPAGGSTAAPATAPAHAGDAAAVTLDGDGLAPGAHPTDRTTDRPEGTRTA